MIGRADLEDLQKALVEIQGMYPVGAVGIMQGGEDNVLVQIIDHGVIPVCDETAPARSTLTLAIAYGTVGRLPLGRQADTRVFPQIHEHGIRGVKLTKYPVTYLCTDTPDAE